jgi:hypothetical protein
MFLSLMLNRSFIVYLTVHKHKMPISVYAQMIQDLSFLTFSGLILISVWT